MKSPVNNTDDRERSYLDGQRSAWRAILSQAIRELDAPADDPQRTIARLTLQLEDTRAALRRACREFGDNEWSDELHLADVVEKHLASHMERRTLLTDDEAGRLRLCISVACDESVIEDEEVPRLEAIVARVTAAAKSRQVIASRIHAGDFTEYVRASCRACNGAALGEQERCRACGRQGPCGAVGR